MKKQRFYPGLIACLFVMLAGCWRIVETPTPELPVVEGLDPGQVETLISLEAVDEYPLYTMRYLADYNHLMADDAAQAPIYGSELDWACSLFAAFGLEENALYGRNFDWEYSPALLLFTDPPDRYATVSMVALQYLVGDQAAELLKLPLAERTELLNAPLLPFDGMNEKGLVVGMAAVPPGNMQPEPNKRTTGSLRVIREMLDRADSVDRALEILSGYHIDFEGGPPLHYLLADSSGRALLVEFYNGEMVVSPNEKTWHLATNYITASGIHRGRCARYDAILDRMEEMKGQLDEKGAMDLLENVSQDITQWSVVYGMHSGRVDVVMGHRYSMVHTLGMDEPVD